MKNPEKSGIMVKICSKHGRICRAEGKMRKKSIRHKAVLCIRGDKMNEYAVGELKTLDETKIKNNIERLRLSGAVIPLTDGVIIGDNVTCKKGTLILPGTVLLGNTVLGENCVVGVNSLLFDVTCGDNTHLNSTQAYSSVIGNGCDIGPFAHIRPDSRIADNVHLGNFVEVKNSALGEKTCVSHLTYIGDSDVGENVNFGCGCVTVNFNGKVKNRCKVGDNSFIGCNTNLVAPVTLGKNAYTAAGSTITDDVPESALAIARARQVNKENWRTRQNKSEDK